MADKLGISEVKDVLALGIGVGELVEALSDGVGISDIGALLAVAKRVKAGVAAVKSGKIVPELKDLDEAEKAELKAFCVEDLDLSDENLEAQIEGGLAIAVELCALLGAF